MCAQASETVVLSLEHHSSVEGKGFKSLAEGDLGSFAKGKCGNGPSAKHVRKL
jgi:cold shock CspA family protein